MLTLTAPYLRLIFIAALFLALSPGCDKSPTEPDPHAPYAPSHPVPSLRSVDQSTNVTLHWSCSDPDGDTLTYALYLGTTFRPTLLADSVTDTSYGLQGLEPFTKYYWLVVARDPDGHATGSIVWSFTTSDSYIYPLEVGNHWNHEGMFYFTNFRPDSLAERLGDTTYLSMSTTITGRDTIFDTIEVYTSHESGFQDGAVWEIDRYLQNAADGLYDFGTDDPRPLASAHAGAPPVSFRWRGRSFASIPELTSWVDKNLERPTLASGIAEVTDRPAKDLHYPLFVGSRWVYRDSVQGMWDIHKRITGIKDIEVPAGTFTCFEIQTLSGVQDNGEWFEDLETLEYISETGLVRRSWIARDVEVIGYELPFGSGLVDVYDELVLTGYHVR